MYNKLKKLDIPHFAIFLNDVQRKENMQTLFKKENEIKINDDNVENNKSFTRIQAFLID